MDELWEKPDRDDLEIHTEIVTGKCRLPGMMLYSGSISGLAADGHYLSKIPYFELLNLAADTRMIINGIAVSISFDLVFLYEYRSCEKNGGRYNIYTEKIQKTFVVDKKDFTGFYDPRGGSRCLCLVKNARHELDYDFDVSSLGISVFADIECLILEAGTVEVADACPGSAEAEERGRCAEGISIYFDEIAQTLHQLDRRVGNCEIRLNKPPDEGK